MSVFYDRRKQGRKAEKIFRERISGLLEGFFKSVVVLFHADATSRIWVIERGTGLKIASGGEMN